MLNPAIGRWMQEDPIRLEGEDTNLYRDCGNDPVNHTDPSGLQDKPGIDYQKAFDAWREVREQLERERKLRKVNDSGATVTFRKGTPGEREIALKATREAMKQIKRANYALKHFFPAIQKRYRVTTPINDVLKYRDWYLKKTEAIAYHSSDIKLDLAGPSWFGEWKIKQQGEGRPTAYVYQSGDAIHTTELFWAAGAADQTDTMVHELGRLIGRIFDADNIYTWDKVIYALDKDFDLLEEWTKELEAEKKGKDR